ncbi:MgtC family protein [Pseudogulbenkiania sp. NH8B]|uniref:MgtC/SapB family protein n=1 Tax=Pseudogulbenkiania sp. (strain NH8B) TaxID=748280 RepID=UPI0002279BE8|nr:MgtC/SapB family protein [Pseudogulbenkiania sp. NH8B]BAK77567.1 MgtC family protein [Pseudogulbenkiania sp. NH8B]
MSGIGVEAWLNLEGTPFAVLPRFVTSLAIGLLLGVERERKQHPLAGIRTFPLAAMLGTMLTMLGQMTATPALVAVGLAGVIALGFLPEGHQEAEVQEPRTTTLVSLMLAYGLGALVWYNQSELAIATAILATALLYLKPELTGIARKLERRDLLSLLQFATLTFIILPILPNRAMGPYLALNPHKIWLMVVLIVGVSLTGYLAVRLLGGRASGPWLGLLGGMVSSTATSLVYAREARSNPGSLSFATSVILLANIVLFLRLIVLAAILVPEALGAMAMVMLPALGLGLITVFLRFRHDQNQDGHPELTLSNPTELKLALGFALMFAVVVLCSAWLHDLYGSRGIYAVALISGVNDVDPITLTVLNLFGEHRLDIHQVIISVVLAVFANNLFKFGLIASLGGRTLAWRCLPTFILSGAGMLGGLLLLGTGVA